MSQTLPVHEGFIPFQGHQTWYRIVGRPCFLACWFISDTGTPRKGPIPHDRLEPLEALAQAGRPVIFCA
ncbi:hypothetical protein [Mastigocladopsis repens]|uniref:hypothetical protein n=1 Tax=Mastigocladopsis repens TaxID=221287 RepID=UPI0002E77223|nr:hypothetical protein [Mastigocladopsis repens]